MLVRPQDLEQQFYAMRKVEPSKKGLSTGFQVLDPYMLLAKGYMMIATGYPGCGKSEFIDAILVNMAVSYGWKTLYFSPENHPIEEHMSKLAEKFYGKRMRKLTQEESAASLEFLTSHFSWIDLEEPNLEAIINLTKADHKERAIDCIVIDPWNAVTHSRGSTMIHEYLSNALSKIIRLARTLKIFVVIVAHPAKPVKDKEGKIGIPTLYDISDGAMWRNKADYGIVFHRPDMMKNQILISVQKIKQKWMGHLGNITMDYHWESGRFKSIEDKEFLLPTEIPLPF